MRSAPKARRRLAALVLVLVCLVAAGAAAVALRDGEEGGQGREGAAGGAAADGRLTRAEAASARLTREVARLPLERQVAQLFLLGFEGKDESAPFFREMRRRGWGGVVLDRPNYDDPGQLGLLVTELDDSARAAGQIAPLVAAPQEGGEASAFTDLPPRGQREIAEADGAPLARTEARRAAERLRGLGIDMTLAPVADVATAGGAAEERAFSDDAAEVTRLTLAAVEGYRDRGIIPAVGHFPGIGTATQDPQIGPASVGLSLDELRRRDLRPFAAAARRAPAIVVSNALYSAYDGITPAVLLPEVVRDLLRDELRFRGVVMSDDLVGTRLATAESTATVAVDAIEAGADLLYISEGRAAQEAAFKAVLEAVRRKRISRERIAESVRRVLGLKRSFGVS